MVNGKENKFYVLVSLEVLSPLAFLFPHYHQHSYDTIRIYIYFFVTASISVIILGTSLGWPSPVLPRMQDEGTPFFMSDEEVSWMVSLLYLGNLLSPIPAGYLMDLLGRKTSLLVLTIIPLSAWVMITFANAPIMLYFARFLAGQF